MQVHLRSPHIFESIGWKRKSNHTIRNENHMILTAAMPNKFQQDSHSANKLIQYYVNRKWHRHLKLIELQKSNFSKFHMDPTPKKRIVSMSIARILLLSVQESTNLTHAQIWSQLKTLITETSPQLNMPTPITF